MHAVGIESRKADLRRLLRMQVERCLPAGMLYDQFAASLGRGQHQHHCREHAGDLLGVAVVDEEAAGVIDEKLVEVGCKRPAHAESGGHACDEFAQGLLPVTPSDPDLGGIDLPGPPDVAIDHRLLAPAIRGRLGDCDEPLGLGGQDRKGDPADAVDIDRRHEDLSNSADGRNRLDAQRNEGCQATRRRYGSRHAWIEGLPAMDLIVTMDDATSEIYSMILVEEEGSASTFEALREVIGEHGLFCSLYTDRGSHYFHTPEAGGKVSSTVETQVGRALAHLGIEHIGAFRRRRPFDRLRRRSERLFATLQDRLPKGVAARRRAQRRGGQRLAEESVHRRAQRPLRRRPGTGGLGLRPRRPEMWREILCVVEERTVAKDNTVAWNGKPLQLPHSRLRPHFVKAQVRVHEYPDGTCAVFLGPHRLADYDAEGALRVPTAPKPGVVLGAVKDKPCRARLRASLTAPARDASSAAQAGTRKRPPSRTRKQPDPNPAIDAA